MTDTTDETKIARDRRRAVELSGGECLAAARIEAEQLTQDLHRKAALGEKLLLDEIAFQRVWVRRLRAWGRIREAERAARLLVSLLKNFKKESKFFEQEIL
jgi:hypothetical protein